MLKLQEPALFTASVAKDSHFAGIKLGNHNQNDGVNFLRNVRLIQILTNPAADETIVIGTKTYTFKVAAALATEITIGGTKPETVNNILARINIDTRACQCSAYNVQDTTRFMLVANVGGATPTVTTDGVKIEIQTLWLNTLAEATLESELVYKIPLTDVNAKPITLVERNAGTYHNFLY